MTYGYGHIATREGDDLWSELHRARVTLLAPDRFFLGRDSASVFRITGMDSTALVGVCGARQVRLAPLLYHRLSRRLAPRGPFMLHRCGAPLWRSEAGMVFTATLEPHTACPRCGTTVTAADLAPLPTGPAVVEVVGTLHVPIACLERRDALQIAHISVLAVALDRSRFEISTGAAAALVEALGVLRVVAEIVRVAASPAPAGE